MIGHIIDQDTEDILKDLTVFLSDDNNIAKVDKYVLSPAQHS